MMALLLVGTIVDFTQAKNWAAPIPIVTTEKPNDLLFRCRQLAKNNPTEALRQIDSTLDEHPENRDLQKFRWYLTEITGRVVETLAKQRQGFDRCHDVWLGKFHTDCLSWSEHTNDCRAMARMLADRHPSDESVVCLNAWFVSTYSGDYKKALSDIEALITKGSNPRLLGWQALLIGTSGDVMRARSLFEKEEASCVNNASWLMSKACFYSQIRETSHIAATALSKAQAIKLTSAVDLEERMRRLLYLGIPDKKTIEQDWMTLNQHDSVPEMAAPRIAELKNQRALNSIDKNPLPKLAQTLRGYNNWHAKYHLAYYTEVDSAALLSRSIALNPGQVSAYNERQANAKNWKTKVDILTKHLCNRRLFDFIAQRASYQETAGNFVEAEQDWAKCYELRPISQEALRHVCYCKSKIDKAAAISFIESECKKHPGDLRLLIVKAETLLECGYTNEAQATIDKIKTLPYPRLEKALLIGSYLEARGYFEKALQVYQKALDDGCDPTPLHLAIVRSCHSEKPQACLNSCNWLCSRYAEHSAERSEAIYFRCIAYGVQKKMREALVQAKLGLKTFPEQTKWFCFVAWMDEPQSKEVKEWYERGMKEHPRERQGYQWHYAAFLSKCKRFEEAIKIYEEAIKSPAPAAVREQWQGEADLLNQLGRTKEAIAKLTEGIEATESQVMYSQRAGMLEKQKRDFEAIKDLDTIVRRLSSSSDGYGISVLNGAICQLTAIWHKTGNSSKAAQCLELGQRFSPGNVFWIDSIFNELQPADIELAKAIYERWRDPNDSSHCDVAYAGYLRRSNFSREALVLLQTLNKSAPNNLEQRKLTVKLARDTAQPDLALKELAFICDKLKPNDEWSWVQRIQLLSELGHQQEAASAIEKAIVISDKTDTFLLMRAELPQRRHADKIADLTKVCRTHPDNCDAWSKLSKLQSSGKAKKSVLDAALKHNTNNVRLLLDRVAVCTTLDPTLALNDINLVLKLDNDSAYSTVKKAEVLQRLGRHREAIGIYKKLVDIEPRKEYVSSYISCLLLSEMYIEASAACDKVLANEPKNTEFWMYKLCALNLSGRTAEFDSALTTVTKLNPALTRSEIKMQCLLKYQSGEVAEFMSVFKEAKNEATARQARLEKLVEREVDFAKRTRYLMQLAEIATKRGRYKEAIAYYDKAMLCEPSNYQLYLKRSSVFHAARQTAKAKQDRMKALELYRKSSAAQNLTTK